MAKSSCSISFFRNDLRFTKLPNSCPVRNCSGVIEKAPFGMKQLPFCPEHGVRIHKNGFVYYNGSSLEDLEIATKRNLLFNGDYYICNFMKKHNKMESSRLCYENSEDAVSYNVFTALYSNEKALKELVSFVVKREIQEEVELYLWGNKIDLANNTVSLYSPLQTVRKMLEEDIKRFKTEPDIMLVIPKKLIICIEAKFGSKNPVALDKIEEMGDKPKKTVRLIERYYQRNHIINSQDLFVDYNKMPKLFYEQIFRNIVFAASMAKIEGHDRWYVINLRNQHVINLNKGKPESFPIMRNIHSILLHQYKRRFIHLTWEDVYEQVIKGKSELANLAWYLKNKSFKCRRAFNIIR